MIRSLVILAIIATQGVALPYIKIIDINNHELPGQVKATQQYYRAACTKNWSRKFYFEKGNRSEQQQARHAAAEAAKYHEEQTGHDSGYLGPY